MGMRGDRQALSLALALPAANDCIRIRSHSRSIFFLFFTFYSFLRVVQSFGLMSRTSAADGTVQYKHNHSLSFKPQLHFGSSLPLELGRRRGAAPCLHAQLHAALRSRQIIGLKTQVETLKRKVFDCVWMKASGC